MFIFLALFLVSPGFYVQGEKLPIGAGQIYCLIAPVCGNVTCSIPKCEPQEILVTHPCSCCPSCQIVPENGCPNNACTTVKCRQDMECPKGQIQTTGGYCGCCAACRDYTVQNACEKVPCPSVLCSEGSVPKVLRGCCPVCIKDVTNNSTK